MPDRALEHLYPPFRAKVVSIIHELQKWCDVHEPGKSPIVVETLRDADRQASLVRAGSSQTQRSRHLEGLAVDIAIRSQNNSISFDDHPFFDYMGHLARLNGLTWGGDWKTIKDCDHIEWHAWDFVTRYKARKWVSENVNR